MVLAGTTPAPLLTGPWDAAAVDSFLEASIIPIRIASDGRSGPLVQSMWFRYDQGILWCATQADAVVAQRLAVDPRVGFEVAGDTLPYRGVRGQGIAEIIPERGPEVLAQLIERYLGSSHSGLARWLSSRADTEVAIGVRPEHLATWDYRQRMNA